MKGKFLIILALMIGMLPTVGCSSHGDIAKRSIVTVTAVTRQEEGGCQVTVEVLTHLGKEEDGRETQTGEGETFAQAVTDIETDAGKLLYLDGCKVLLLKGFRDREAVTAILEEVDAYGGIRPLTLVAVSPDPEGLLEQREGGEAPGDEVFTLLTGGELSQINIRDCLNLMNTPGRGLLLPVVERVNEGETEEAETEGEAEADGEKNQARVTGYLSPGARGTLQAPASLGKLLPFARPEESHGKVYTVIGEDYSADWVLEKNHLSIRPDVTNGTPSFTLSARVEGYLLSHRGELEGEKLERRAQEDICRQLVEEYQSILEEISRDSGNDIFSLGKHLELFRPQSWKINGESWEEKLPEIGLTIQGSVLLRDEKRLLRHG